MQWKRMLLWSARVLQDDGIPERVRTDLVRLIPFDVQIALRRPAPEVSSNALLDIVTDWMNDAFYTKAMNQGLISTDLNSNTSSTTFQTVALERTLDRQRNLRALQESGTETAELYTASFTGVSLWERRGSEVEPIDPEFVELIQRATFLEDNKLLTSLQSADATTGLGFAVVDVRAFITPTPLTGSGTAAGSNLEVIIIIAIVVACMAFGLLMFAVLWAWRTDRSKREAYKVDGPPRQGLGRTPDGTGSESDYEENSPKHHHRPGPAHNTPPTEINPQAYPESVISEDISTSLTAYYKSGMTGYNIPRREMNDAASMSSMDSYGYSLDGYAPSLSGGPTQMGYPVGPIEKISPPQDTQSEEGGYPTGEQAVSSPQETTQETVEQQ